MFLQPSFRKNINYSTIAESCTSVEVSDTTKLNKEQ